MESVTVDSLDMPYSKSSMMLSTARQAQTRLRNLFGVLVVVGFIVRDGLQVRKLSIEITDQEVTQINRRPPQKPLRPDCLAIIQNMSFVDTIFVPVAAEHSHLGAVNSWGMAGYVHDVTKLRQKPPPFSMTRQEMAAECMNQDDDYKMIKERFVVDLEYERQMQQSGKPRPKILCIIYTSKQGHSRIKNIRETWGPKCDGFLVASDTSDASVDSVKILHEGPERYFNMWQKVRSMWEYIYDNYYNEYDFYHIGGDDMYLIVENLRLYLESDEIQAAQNGGMFISDKPERMQIPLYLGERYMFRGRSNDTYNTGGPGYTLNRAAVKTLVVDGLPYHHADVVSPMEDVYISRVFALLGVVPYQTRDDNQGERYMHYSPSFYYNFQSNRIKRFQKFYIDPVEGFNHSSPHSIAFHKIADGMMKRVHSLLNYQCPSNILSAS
ncbi:hypothetical protein MPSEU_000115300 [Mayamaea pseudoterrestris]|nr:hypothetical protein MPSEU_000115300 [Mayamaea pseudoterrestris]